MRGSLPIPKDASIEARRTPEGSLYCDVIATALVDMAEGRGSRARRTAETFFFKPDPRCDNQPRADRWCSAIGFEPDFVRKIAREIANGKIDVDRRVEDYRTQRDRYRRELRGQIQQRISATKA
jgi:hypothetical protein